MTGALVMPFHHCSRSLPVWEPLWQLYSTGNYYESNSLHIYLQVQKLTYKSWICIQCSHPLLHECHRARMAISEIVGFIIVQEWPLPIPSRLKWTPDNLRFPETSLRKRESFGRVMRGRWQIRHIGSDDAWTAGHISAWCNYYHVSWSRLPKLRPCLISALEKCYGQNHTSRTACTGLAIATFVFALLL